MHFLVVLAAAQNDAADSVPAVSARGGHDLFAVLAPVQSFDLPNIRLDAGVLKLHDGLHHQLGTKLEVVGFLVSFETLELRLLWRHEQFEHEPAATLAVQVIRQSFQT